MTARYFYLGCLGKLGDDYKTPCKTPIHADCSAFSEEIELSQKAPKFSNGNRVRITKYENIFSNFF